MKVHIRIITTPDLVNLAYDRINELYEQSLYNLKKLYFLRDQEENIELLCATLKNETDITIYWQQLDDLKYCFIDYNGHRDALCNINSIPGCIINALLNREDPNSTFSRIEEIPSHFTNCEYLSFEGDVTKPWLEIEGIDVPAFSV